MDQIQSKRNIIKDQVAKVNAHGVVMAAPCYVPKVNVNYRCDGCCGQKLHELVFENIGGE